MSENSNSLSMTAIRFSTALLAAALCGAPPLLLASSNGESNSTRDGDWTVLFDGSSPDDWRGFQQEEFPDAGWEIDGEVLRTVPGRSRTDIITREKYSRFELELEWRVGPGGNSGIFYHVSEEPEVIWHWAPEIQILDDEGGGLPPDHIHSSGSLYDVCPPSADKKVAPTGEFNQARLVVRENKVEHWLNGEKILEYDLESEKTRDRIEKSKFPDEFGRLHEGHIGLQHHGDEVAFRNIRVRVLPEE